MYVECHIFCLPSVFKGDLHPSFHCRDQYSSKGVTFPLGQKAVEGFCLTLPAASVLFKCQLTGRV